LKRVKEEGGFATDLLETVNIDAKTGLRSFIGLLPVVKMLFYLIA